LHEQIVAVFFGEPPELCVPNDFSFGATRSWCDAIRGPDRIGDFR
jgi:hypothetical protein